MALFGCISDFIESKESWSQYVERLEQFFIANDIVSAKKKSIFLSLIGPVAYHTLGNLVAPKTPADETYEHLVELMSNFYHPKPLVTVQRYRFYSRFRQPSESISTFVAELRSLAKDCNFEASLEENLRDRLVCGINDETIQKRLLSEHNLSFKKAFDLAQGHESAARNIVTLQGSSSTSYHPEVHKLSYQSTGIRHSQACYRCGQSGHRQEDCKFKMSTCHHCGKVGHIRPVCRSNKSSSSSRSPSHPRTISNRPFTDSSRSSNRSLSDNRSRSYCSSYRSSQPRSSDVKQIVNHPPEDVEEYSLFCLPSSSKGPLFVTLTINDISLSLEVDTGASYTVISKCTYDQLFSSHKLQSSNIKLKTYTGEVLYVFGEITVNVKYQTQNLDLVLIIAGDNGPSLLGRSWLYSLRLDWDSIFHINSNSRLPDLFHKYSAVFNDGLGTLKGFKVKLYVDDDHAPIYCKARPVPYAIRSEVENELEKLQQQGIIEPVNFSDWAAPIVPVLKADKKSIRICGDFKLTVNRVSKLDRYPIPKVNVLFSSISGGVIFSKLDLSQAYQQLELDEESKKYTVINTHRGLFRYNRLPFGISSSPGIFQRSMENLLCGIPRVIVYLDDILISGVSEEDHLRNLELVLNKLKSAGLLVRKDKCKFFVKSITYLGHKIDAEGLHPLPDKIEAISKAAVPQTVTELKAFLGLMNYYGKFIPNLSSLLHPLYQLLNKSVQWSWSAERNKAFEESKKLLTSDSVLIHFDPQMDLLVSCDASAYGVGAVLSHKLTDGSERPIAFSSRTLSSAERSYSQIEKETLACVFGVKKFHSYIYGRKFSLITDHKPLLTLLHEHHGIPTTTSNRIQRWALTLSMYEYSIAFKQSSAHANADALSRLPLQVTSVDPPVPSETVLVLEQLSESPISVSQIRSWTMKDPTLSKVVHFVLSGWPFEVSSSLKPFYNRRVELSTQDGVLLWGYRVIVPPPGRDSILQELHTCHPGIAHMKTLARMFVWWPCMDSDIETFVKNCSVCQSSRPSPSLAPIRPWSWPSRPWSRLHLDFAGPFMGHMFLIVIDAYSKWLEVCVMNSTISTAIISELRRIFARFGLPSIIVTDNARNFTSSEFETFLSVNGVKHMLSSPYHPNSNGLAERAVQSFKHSMLKVKDGSVIDKVSHVLFYSHITPHSTTGLSSSELLQNRRLRSRLDLIFPDLETRVSEKQSSQQYYSNRHAKSRNFDVGEAVYIRNFGVGVKWIPGIISSIIGNVSYNIVTQDGRSFRRHIDHIRKKYDSDIPIPTLPLPNSNVDIPEMSLGTPQSAVIVPSETVTEPSPIITDTDSGSPTPSDIQTSLSDSSSSVLPDSVVVSPTSTHRRYPDRDRRHPNRYTPKF